MILPGGTATEQLDQAVLAEQAGWDGVFVWEAAYGVDAWSLLAAIAVRTSRVRLGTLLTPLPWRRPWKVASQVATLDQLSGGRAILSVGLGALTTDLPDTGEVTGTRPRAGLMDEGIDLIRGLWAGRTSYKGQHYQYECSRSDLAEVRRPVQDRIPIWVVAAWPRPRSMRSALRCDGVIPEYHLDGGQDGRRAHPVGGGRLHLVAGVAVGDAAPRAGADGPGPPAAGGRPATGGWLAPAGAGRADAIMARWPSSSRS